MKQLINNKRYLTGIDWLIHVFDYMNHSRIGTGNAFHIILEVDGLIDGVFFERELNQFVEKHSVFKGQTAIAWNLAPYWKINNNKEIQSTRISSVQIQDIFDLIPYCRKIFRKHDHSNNNYLSCDVILHEKKSYIAFTFSHKIFDGIGAEFFLEDFRKYLDDKPGYIVQDQYCEPSHLNKWGEKFRAGKQVNQKLIWLSPGRKIRAFPIKENNEDYKYNVIQFDKEQTNKIIERANKEAGYLLIMPFLLGQAVCAFNQLLNKKGIRNGSMVVPVTVNARKKREVNKIFFNHLSFMFFRFINKEAEDPVNVIKSQLYEQTKSGLTDKFGQNAMLMRILPVSILSKLLGLYSKGTMASFSFSYLGETGLAGKRLLGKKVFNVFHLPRPSVPPGLGIFLNNYNGKMSLTISYLSELLDKDDVLFLVDKLKKMPNE